MHLYGCEEVSVGIYPLIFAWVKGHRVHCPPVKLRTPPWDLSAVLVALTEKEFEPLNKVDMKALTYKVLFLVALASARHILEFHALSVETPFLIERAHSFNLAVNTAFLLKTITMNPALSGDMNLWFFILIRLAIWNVGFSKCAL